MIEVLPVVPVSTDDESIETTCSFCGGECDLAYHLVENTTLCAICYEADI